MPKDELGIAFQELKWSGAGVPAVGEIIEITMNAIGPSKVLGYFAQEGYLGIMHRPLDPPEWWLQQNGYESVDDIPDDKYGTIFGAEMRRIPEEIAQS